jgi:chromosome partitioning protein
MQASGMDAKAAAKSVNLVRQQERAFNRTIPMAVVFTRTNPAIRTDLQGSLRRQLESAKVRVFQVEIFERVAFKEMFNKGATLESLLELQPKKAKAIRGAIENAKSFAGETVGILKSNAAPNKPTATTSTTERIAA